jgi:Holliday junction DNA helicase RuvA
MISRLKGRVWDIESGCVILDVSGVGYEVKAPEDVLAQAREGEEIEVFVRTTVREDDISFFGFLNRDQRALFDMLRDVKGCGARTSLAVLSTLGDTGCRAAISAQDAKMVARTPGVGPKLAERIILELKEKVNVPGMTPIPDQPAAKKEEAADELIQALMSLGYRRGEVDDIADKARKESDAVADQIKFALRMLSS